MLTVDSIGRSRPAAPIKLASSLSWPEPSLSAYMQCGWIVNGGATSEKIWFLESMRDVFAVSKRRPWLNCGMRFFSSHMRKSVSRMLSRLMDVESIMVKVLATEVLVACLMTLAVLLHRLFLFLSPPPDADASDLLKSRRRAHAKSRSAGPGCDASFRRLYSHPCVLRLVPTCASSLAKSPPLASRPDTMFLRKLSVIPRLMTSAALGMHAPAARLALITLPVDAMRCIGSWFLPWPSVKSLVSCACASHFASSFLESARMLISERHWRCTSISCAKSKHSLRVLPSCPIMLLIFTTLAIAGAPCSLVI